MGKKIRQRVLAGSNFNATPPTKGPIMDNAGFTLYAKEEGCGEFSPGGGTLRSILLLGGNQSSTEFQVAFADGRNEQILVSSHPDRQVRWDGNIDLVKGDKVLVRTTGGRRPMSCEIILS